MLGRGRAAPDSWRMSRTFTSTPGSFWIDATITSGQTYYYELPVQDVTSIQIAGDGVAAATITVQHTDFAFDLAGAAVTPTSGASASDARIWKDDPAIGSLSLAASTGSTGGVRVTFTNAPRRSTRVKVVASATGRIVGNWSGIV